MATHAQNIQNLRDAVYGEQVRGSMIELFEEDYDLCSNGVLVGTDISSTSDPTTGYPDGTLYINNSSWTLFKLEGTAWADKGTIVGPQGTSVTGVHDNGDGTFYLIFSNGTHSGNIATIQGIQGPTGPTGPQGVQGPAGRDVTSITMSGTGKSHPITATYSDGSTQTVGVVQDGADGSGTGDMSKATYDPSDHGYVDLAAGVTDGTHTLTYTTLNNKANKSTTLMGYGITDAYSTSSADAIFIKKPDPGIAAGNVLVSDGAQDANWQTIIDQTYSSVSTKAQSGVAVEEGLDYTAHRIVITTTSTKSAGSTIIIPEPTESGGVITATYDEHIKQNSIIYPIADSISNRPLKYTTVETVTTVNTLGNVVGRVFIKIAEDIPANFNIGVLVVNR